MPTPADIEAIYNAIRLRLTREGSPSSTTGKGPTGPQGPQGPQGPKGVTWKGQWADETDYELGDIVYWTTTGSSILTFMCLADHSSVAGSNEPAPGGTANFWHEISPGYLIIDGSRAMTGDLNMNGAGGPHDLKNVQSLYFIGASGEAKIDDPIVIFWRETVLPGSDYTEQEGAESWSALEGVNIISVLSGAALVAMAFGWSVIQAFDGEIGL